MKIRSTKQQLLNAVNIAGRAVAVKTTMPILECLLITADNMGISIMANDGEMAVNTLIPSEKCEVEEPGTIAVEAKLLSEILRKISSYDDAEVILSSDGNLVEISSGKAMFRIQEKDPVQFPELPSINENVKVILSEFTLKEIVRDTIFSISLNDSNRMMTGELFEIKDNVLTVIALDGHRVSIRNTPLTASYDHVRTIIPGKTLSEVSKIISGDAEKNVVISFDPNYVSFRFDETLMLSRIIDGDYFRIESMLTSDYDTKITVNKKEFLDAIEQSTVLIRENDKKPLVLKIEEGKLGLRVNSLIGSLDASIPAEKTGADLMIAFNPKFLLDALRVIDEETVTLYMTNSKAPCFIRDEEKTYIYLILPVNFNPAAY